MNFWLAAGLCEFWLATGLAVGHSGLDVCGADAMPQVLDCRPCSIYCILSLALVNIVMIIRSLWSLQASNTGASVFSWVHAAGILSGLGRKCSDAVFLRRQPESQTGVDLFVIC